MADKGHILIVDDALENIQVLGTMLRGEGYKVNAAMNGIQALKQVEKAPPELILLDVMMPELDGIETCKRLKEDDRTKDIPVVFLTSRSELSDMVVGFDMGAADYVTKPFDGPELLRRVETNLKLYQTQKELTELRKRIKPT